MKSASLDIIEVIDLENDATTKEIHTTIVTTTTTTRTIKVQCTHDGARNVSNTSTLSSIM